MPEYNPSDAGVTTALEPVAERTEVLTRAEEVRQRIFTIREDVMSKALELGRLLLEARDKSFNVIWGYDNFGLWVEEDSGLDMSQRAAYYLINVVQRADELGITDEQLKRVKLSKLKEIFSLKDTDPEVIKELLARAEGSSLNDIRDDVAMVKAADGGDPFTFWNMKMPITIKEEIVKPAFEKARRLYGNTMHGADAPDWKCLELCCVSMLNEPVENTERQDYIDTTCEDMTETREV